MYKNKTKKNMVVKKLTSRRLHLLALSSLAWEKVTYKTTYLTYFILNIRFITVTLSDQARKLRLPIFYYHYHTSKTFKIFQTF